MLALLGLSLLAAPAPLLFMSDFGVVDDSVAVCKGVMLQVEPSLRIVDITHDVPPYSVLDGARFLAGTAPYYPKGTVFVVVVDPGVGTSRKSIVAKSKRGQFFVLPDNGLITLVEQRDGLEGIREITNRAWMIDAPVSSTFHGRDVFSPVGAHLARGDDWTKVGPLLKDHVRLGIQPATLTATSLKGEVLAVELPYGNLKTNVDAATFAKLGYQHGATVPVSIGGKELILPYARTFGDVPEGKPLLYVDSRGNLAVALNQGSFAAAHGIKAPAALVISRRK